MHKISILNERNFKKVTYIVYVKGFALIGVSEKWETVYIGLPVCRLSGYIFYRKTAITG